MKYHIWVRQRTWQRCGLMYWMAAISSRYIASLLSASNKRNFEEELNEINWSVHSPWCSISAEEKKRILVTSQRLALYQRRNCLLRGSLQPHKQHRILSRTILRNRSNAILLFRDIWRRLRAISRERRANYVNLNKRKRKSRVNFSMCNLIHQMATCVEIVTFDLVIRPEIVLMASAGPILIAVRRNYILEYSTTEDGELLLISWNQKF